MLTLTTVILSLLIVYGLSYMYFRPMFADWELPEYNKRTGLLEERFGRLHGWWEYVTGASAVVGVVSTLIVHAKLGDQLRGAVWFPDMMFGLLGFYLTFMAVTDFFTQKAPFDVQDLTLAVIAPAGVLGIVFNLYPKNYFTFVPENTRFDDVLQLAPWLIFALVLAVLFFRGMQGIGFADIAVFGIGAFGLAAMIGVQAMAYALILACITQGLAFIGAQIWGWGTIVPTPYARMRRVINGVWRKVTGSDSALMGTDSRQLAWLPMICLSYLVVGLVFV